MPMLSPATPKCLRAVCSSRHTITTAREPICFSSQTTRGTPSSIVGKGLGRMLQQAWFAGCLGGRHGWRQIDQPFWIGGKATHDLQRCDGVFFAYRDVLLQASRNVTLAGDIFHVQNIVVLLLCSKGGSLVFSGKERPGGFPVGMGGRNRYQFLFWVAQRR